MFRRNSASDMSKLWRRITMAFRAGLDIQGADVDAIMKAAEDSVAGMDQSL